MKDFIIAFLICLSLTCWINGSGYPPAAMPVTVTKVNEGALGLKREDGVIPEIIMTDTGKPTGMITGVTDAHGNREGLVFPLNGNN